MSEPEPTPLGKYGLFAEIGFCKYFHFGGAEATRELIQACGIFEKACLLDVGCASGKTACTLARLYGCRVVGVDLLPKMVEEARQRARDEGVEGLVDFRVGDAQALPLEAGQFDVMIGEFIAGLLESKEKAVQEYVRVVKPGGTIGLNEATWIKPPPPGFPLYLAMTVGLRGEVLTVDG